MAATGAAALLDAFADDALYAHWDGSGDETAARSIARGRDEIARAFETTGAGRLEPLVWVGDDADRFVEGRLVAPEGQVAASFAAVAQLDEHREIARCLSFQCPPVQPSPSWGMSTPAAPGSGRAILERYLDHLGAGELATAAECFSADCLYSHPPYAPGTPRMEFRGRDELLRGLRQTRGPGSSRPEVVCSVQRGADCFIEGVVEGVGGPKGSFVSSASLDGDGLIRRYVAFYTSSRIPRR
jgi:hypothetical protein